MQKLFFIVLIAMIAAACASVSTKNTEPIQRLDKEIKLYSEAVKDSFYIKVQLPDQYNEKPERKYPTVYIVDANFYFPMLAEVVKQYTIAGLLPPVILVGIGYKSFTAMDSLRERDYLYPASIPSDEMKAVGGGKNFNNFVVSQLIPHIDAGFRTDTSNRSLMGHSFGGYFSLYALLNQAENNQTTFRNIASASPSLWYNNFYLSQLSEKLQNRKTGNPLNVYMTVGGLEDPKWNINPAKKMADELSRVDGLNMHYTVYNDLEHMDVAMITFSRALHAFYKTD
ncbi:alpha/beta hydrolase [Emticicia sp. BO119]|uniref:alpha/beta hydrolase n=1 Tax=Emticicia sp. BO119 TaxID=2757768 RepID=UPI0015EFFFB3|nr:alpha/beta hydrolase-fold protein [Emticicia sp. BO119]MBA4852152.1 alpha/beta hydrolase [Emticicia sp. BO119]